MGPALAAVARVISSPLARARDTAEALGTGLPIEIDDRWIEVDYGEFDGTPLGAVPAEVWTRWRTDPDFRPPGRRDPRRGRHPGPVGLRGAVRHATARGPGARARWWW